MVQTILRLIHPIRRILHVRDEVSKTSQLLLSLVSVSVVVDILRDTLDSSIDDHSSSEMKSSR